MVRPGFRFGLEGEYLLVEAAGRRPLWHPDLSFCRLNALLEAVPYEAVLDGRSLEGLELDPPHRKLMPFYVEGYGVPGPGLLPWIDILPKGIEVRTPVCGSIAECIAVYRRLLNALQAALAGAGLRAVA